MDQELAVIVRAQWDVVVGAGTAQSNYLDNITT